MFIVATWNVNSLRVRLPHVIDWLEQVNPDILALQETKLADSDFPAAELSEHGYQSVFSGQKTYNGVAILSKTPATDINTEFPSYPDPQRRILSAKINNIPILNLYVPNGAEVGSEKYAYKLEWLSHLQIFVEAQLKANNKLIVLGDFNIAPTDADVHDPEEWQGKVLVSEPERDNFFRLIDKNLVDCFVQFEQPEKSFSWWDYRAGGFRRNRGLRIDHILASAPLAKRCKSCHIDKGPRKLERPSDHAPVVAEFDL